MSAREETDGGILARLGVDAEKWANEFMAVNDGEDLGIDEGVLLAWFANAIEAGRSAGFMDAVNNPAEVEIVRNALAGDPS
jgi:hypothetical protein